MIGRVVALISGALLASSPAVAKNEAPRRPILYDYYAKSFEGFSPPEFALIESQAARTVLPRDTAETWWRDAMIVMMQKGPVVFASREAKILAAPPYVAYSKSVNGETYLYVIFLRELYRDAADPAAYALAVDAPQAKSLEELLLQEIAAQMKVSADAAAAGH